MNQSNQQQQQKPYKDISKQWRNENQHIKNMSLPISLEEFGLDHIERSLSSEYKILTFMTQTQFHLQKLYQNPQQFPFNRNSHIMTYHPTKPILSEQQQEKDKIQHYINANIITLVDKKTIATQGPLTSTFYNLYRMIQKYKITSIFMLCCIIQKNKMKCDRYWPNQETEGGKMVEKQYQITLLSEKKQPGLKTRKINIKNTNNQFEIQLTQYQIINWPDGDKPHTQSKKLLNHVLQEYLKRLNNNEYPIVHCSAGVGRTGTFIAMALFKKLLQTQTQISVFENVRQLREQRWGMVYTFSQYQYLYDFVQEEIAQKKNKQNGIDVSQEDDQGN